MTPREKIIEAMARAISEIFCHDPDDWEFQAGTAEAALTAISEQGYAVVPRVIGIGTLVAVLPVTDEGATMFETYSAKAAIKRLGDGGNRQQALEVARDVAVDYRLFVAAADIARPDTPEKPQENP